jgi:hypothetical protein
MAFLSCPLLNFLLCVWQVKVLPIPVSGRKGLSLVAGKCVAYTNQQGEGVELIKRQHKILIFFTYYFSMGNDFHILNIKADCVG